ncbi:hypothetical protein DRP44_05590 [candidate division TA06 bacterium]|uniref:Uncharacterized protein n=1 Tax=candidate division TA06 bacterium TaxID=2250710 RepID=A0A660S9C7_UNCT6|nr:MAG: hypothetical protein DRP44_05590 [candidate division TA06 bacterium]
MIMDNNLIVNIEQLIEKSNSILVFAHKRPDGDAVGSVIAFSLFLKSKGKKVTALLPDDPPPEYDFLKGFDSIVKKAEGEFDLYISLDEADLSRTYNIPDNIPKEKIINIDHHKSNTYFGGLNVVLPDYSSTCEILIEIVGERGNTDIYNALYTGMLTDTGGFKYANTSVRTLKHAIELIEKGVNHAYISQMVFMRMTRGKIKLLALALETLEFYGDKAVMTISLDMLNKTGTTMKDTESITGYTLVTRGIELGVLLREEAENRTRVSFRSKGKYDVDLMAKEFGGGGHKEAAGCTIDTDLQTASKIIKEKVIGL